MLLDVRCKVNFQVFKTSVFNRPVITSKCSYMKILIYFLRILTTTIFIYLVQVFEYFINSIGQQNASLLRVYTKKKFDKTQKKQ